MNAPTFTAPLNIYTQEEAVFNVFGSVFTERDTDYGVEVSVKVGTSDSSTAVVTFMFYDTRGSDTPLPEGETRSYDVDMRVENNDSVSPIYYPEVVRLAVEAMVNAGYMTKFGDVVDNGF